jgi:hypothetical protein
MLVGRKSGFFVLLKRFQKQQRFVKRKRADGIGEQELERVGRERPELRGGWLARLKEWQPAFVLDALAGKRFGDALGYERGVPGQFVGINFPVDFRAAGECGHRVGFDAVALNAEFLTLDKRSARAAERVQDSIVRSQLKTVDVGPDKVGWEGKNEAIPIVGCPVLKTQLIIFARGQRDLALVLWRFYNGRIDHYPSYDKENVIFLPAK